MWPEARTVIAWAAALFILYVWVLSGWKGIGLVLPTAVALYLALWAWLDGED
jgi:hypothetical protein